MCRAVLYCFWVGAATPEASRLPDVAEVAQYRYSAASACLFASQIPALLDIVSHCVRYWINKAASSNSLSVSRASPFVSLSDLSCPLLSCPVVSCLVFSICLSVCLSVRLLCLDRSVFLRSSGQPPDFASISKGPFGS